MNFYRSRIALSLGMVALLSGAPAAKGISVRFLASPEEDSVVRYEIYRCDTAGGAARRVGEVIAAPGGDTLGFRDLGAEKGRSYSYTIKGFDARGGASDPSEQTEVGFPLLALPDTLRSDKATGITRTILPPLSDPLRGREPMALSLLDSSRFSLAYDPAAGAVTFRSRVGHADSGWVTVRGLYFGKFEDRDSLLIQVAAAPAASLPSPAPGQSGPSAPASRFSFPARYSPLSQGPIRWDGLPGPDPAGSGNLEILTLLGSRTRVLATPGGGYRLSWDGRDRWGRLLRPARYLWTARNAEGSLLKSGSFLIVP